MEILVEFVRPVSREKILHNLRNVKKCFPMLRHFISQVTDDRYYLKDEKGNIVAEIEFIIVEDAQAVKFQDFRGKYKEDVERMISFRLIEEIGEKAFIFNKEKKYRIYFSLDGFFLLERNKIYKIGLDYEKIVAISLGQVPRELKVGQKVAVGNSTC